MKPRDFSAWRRKHDPDAAIIRTVVYQLQIWERSSWRILHTVNTLPELRAVIAALPSFMKSRKFRYLQISTQLKPFQFEAITGEAASCSQPISNTSDSAFADSAPVIGSSSGDSANES
jgi:hypothetical protein